MRSNGDNSTDSNAPASMAGVGTHEVVRDLFEKFVSAPAKVVDLAAGQGAFSLVLQRLGHDVTAVDFSRENWKATNIPLELRDLDSEFAASIIAEHGKFDAVAAIEIVEHLENPFRFIRQCAELLKPNGLMFLTTPNVE